MMKNTRVILCLVALLALVMATSLPPCYAEGTAAGDDPWAKKCVPAKGCAAVPNPPPYHDDACKAMCFQEGYDTDKSYCYPDDGGTCCCVKN